MTNLKKFGLGVIGLLTIGVIYYVTTGSAQLTTNMKAQVNKELASIQTQGFSVEERQVSDKKEHFILSFDEPKKITAFLTTKGAKLSVEDVEALKGLKVGVDVSYLADAYSSVSFDIYPLTLPTAFELDNAKVLKQIETMLDKKTFLVHVDVNKLGNGFKGYMNDIDEVVNDKQKIRFKMTALKFSGDLKDDKLKSVKQTLKNLTIRAEDEITVSFENLKSNYKLTGATKYDYVTDYTIEKIDIDAKKELQFHVSNIIMNSNSSVIDNLATTTVQTEIKNVHFSEGKNVTTLNNIFLDLKASNLDVTAFEKLENIDPDDEKAMMAVFQQLISKGVTLDMPNFSIESIEIDKEKIDGFTLSTSFQIDKSLNLSNLGENPMSAISAIDANLHLSLSDGLFAYIAKQPQAVMVMMMIQPQTLNDKKVYKVELKNGKLNINGKPML